MRINFTASAIRNEDSPEPETTDCRHGNKNLEYPEFPAARSNMTLRTIFMLERFRDLSLRISLVFFASILLLGSSILLPPWFDVPSRATKRFFNDVLAKKKKRKEASEFVQNYRPNSVVTCNRSLLKKSVFLLLWALRSRNGRADDAPTLPSLQDKCPLPLSQPPLPAFRPSWQVSRTLGPQAPDRPRRNC